MADDITSPWVWYTDERMLEAENERDPRLPYDPEDIPIGEVEGVAGAYSFGGLVTSRPGPEIIDQPWFLAVCLMLGVLVLGLVLVYS